MHVPAVLVHQFDELEDFAAGRGWAPCHSGWCVCVTHTNMHVAHARLLMLHSQTCMQAHPILILAIVTKDTCDVMTAGAPTSLITSRPLSSTRSCRQPSTAVLGSCSLHSHASPAPLQLMEAHRDRALPRHAVVRHALSRKVGSVLFHLIVSR